jgi:enoyl-CoA hydratase/carnithine racemase
VSGDVLLAERSGPGVVTLTLNRPAQLNALNATLVRALIAALDGLAGEHPGVRVIVLRGAGRAFCGGADLKWLHSDVLGDPAALGRFHDDLAAVCRALESAPQVVIGAAHGYALAGGLELLLSCDMIVAARDASLGDEHIRRNLIPGAGGSQRLPRRIGLARGLYALLTGHRMTGAEAERWGLACACVEPGELDTAAAELARGIAERDGDALATMKSIVRRGLELPLQEGLWLELDQQHLYRSRSAAMNQGIADFAASAGTGRGSTGGTAPPA